MYLIVGLGNPDKIYQNTFHNAGFMCLDRLAKLLNVEFAKGECRAVTAHTRANGQKVILAKPVTYMNLSGQSLLELCQRYKIEMGNLIVVYDDIDIPLGSLRIRKFGSPGTHNGMRSITKLLGTQDFARFRIGIGKPRQMELADYVMSKVCPDDKILFEPTLDNAAQAIADFLSGQTLDAVMQKYNSTTEKSNIE